MKSNLLLKILLLKMWRRLHPIRRTLQEIDLECESLSNQNIRLELTGPSVTKKCKICGKQKDIARFYRNGTWRRPECSTCFRELQNDYNKLKKEHPTPELGTPCECCGKTDEKLQWDHCHETKSHRGWLCSNCNTGIGKLGDNLEGVTNAVNYFLQLDTVEDDRG